MSSARKQLIVNLLTLRNQSSDESYRKLILDLIVEVCNG